MVTPAPPWYGIASAKPKYHLPLWPLIAASLECRSCPDSVDDVVARSPSPERRDGVFFSFLGNQRGW